MHDPHFFNLIIIRRTLRTVNIRQTPSTVSYLQFQLVPFTLQQILKCWPNSSIISAVFPKNKLTQDIPVSGILYDRNFGFFVRLG